MRRHGRRDATAAKYYDTLERRFNDNYDIPPDNDEPRFVTYDEDDPDFERFVELMKQVEREYPAAARHFDTAKRLAAILKAGNAET